MDGQLKEQVPYGSPNQIAYGLNVSNDLLIGGYNFASCPPGNNFTFPGEIDEVEVFNRALSQSEIQSIFDAVEEGKCKLQTIAIDIKPGSDPNCFNINGHGVVPVALLGSADFDVHDVDQDNLSFNGLTVRLRGNKGPLCHETDVNGDAYADLVCQFEGDADMWEIGSSIGVVTGQLIDATPIRGEDTICIRPDKKKNK